MKLKYHYYNIYYCSAVQEATRLALVSGDQPCYARSIRIMGDIYRKKMEIGVRNPYFISI